MSVMAIFQQLLQTSQIADPPGSIRMKDSRSARRASSRSASYAASCIRNRKRSVADSTGMGLIKANCNADEHLGQAGKLLPFRSLMSRIACLAWKTR